MTDLADLKHETLAAIAGAADEAALEAVRVAALGKKGSISALLATLGKLSPEERKTRGAAINALKDSVAEALAARRGVLKGAALDARLERRGAGPHPAHAAAGVETGRIHPISQVTDEIVAIFADMGFSVAEGPDIESDDYNFTKLNFPPGHPAREMHDTFFLAPGRERRAEAPADAHEPGAGSHDAEPEAAYPGDLPGPDLPHRLRPDPYADVPPGRGPGDRQSANLGNLKWVLEEFCKAFFEVPKVGMRFRPSFFPFTSPSMEVDIQCRRSGGEIRFGEGEDWLEILGCGMVHANVLTNCGIDPEVYQGFAWGMGIDRMAMLKYGMPDLRDLFDADLRWIDHYGFEPLDMPTLAGGLSG